MHHLSNDNVYHEQFHSSIKLFAYNQTWLRVSSYVSNDTKVQHSGVSMNGSIDALA